MGIEVDGGITMDNGKFKEIKGKENFFDKIIRLIEVVGNKLPNPVILFFLVWLFVLILSQLLNGVSATDPSTGKTVMVKGLLNGKDLIWMIKSMVKNYTSFSPLGVVLVMMIGLGVTTGSGLLNEAMKKIAVVPEKWLVFILLFVGICGNIASGAASAIIPALGAALFHAAHKDPIFGLCIGFAGVTAGFTANLALTGTDALLAGISTTAYQLVKPNASVSIACNYYFMFASTLVIAVVATLVVNKFLMPRYGQWNPKYDYCQASIEIKNAEKESLPSELVNKGLHRALLATVIYWAFLIGILNQILLDGIVIFMMLYFIVVGLVFGWTTGTMKNVAQLVKGMENGLKSCIGFLVIAFPISNAIAAFGRSGIANVLAIELASFCVEYGITGVPLFITVILIVSFVNLFLVSSSSKWALLSPIIVPFMYYLGYTPEAAQVLYRIGDSCTNIITPLQPFIGMHLAVIRRYDADAGLGSIFSRTLPLSFTFFVTWIILLLIWNALGLPLGPGGVGFTL